MRSDDESKTSHRLQVTWTGRRSRSRKRFSVERPLEGGRGALIRRVLQGRWLLEAWWAETAVGYSRDSLHCRRGRAGRGDTEPLPDNLVAQDGVIVRRASHGARERGHRCWAWPQGRRRLSKLCPLLQRAVEAGLAGLAPSPAASIVSTAPGSHWVSNDGAHVLSSGVGKPQTGRAPLGSVLRLADVLFDNRGP
jgi:hypothetical protein